MSGSQTRHYKLELAKRTASMTWAAFQDITEYLHPRTSSVNSELDDETFSGSIEQTSVDLTLNNQTGRFNLEGTDFSLWSSVEYVEHSRIRLYEWIGTGSQPTIPLIDGLIQGHIRYPSNFVAEIVVVSRLDILKTFFPFAPGTFPYGAPYFNGGLISANHMLRVIFEWANGKLGIVSKYSSLKYDLLLESKDLRDKSAFEIFESIRGDSAHIGGLDRQGNLFLTYFGATLQTRLSTGYIDLLPTDDPTVCNWSEIGAVEGNSYLSTVLQNFNQGISLSVYRAYYNNWGIDVTGGTDVVFRRVGANFNLLESAVFSGANYAKSNSALYGVSVFIRMVKNQVLGKDTYAHNTAVSVQPVDTNNNFVAAIDFENTGVDADYLDTMYSPIWVFSSEVITLGSCRNYSGLFLGPENKLYSGGYTQNTSANVNLANLKIHDATYTADVSDFLGLSTSANWIFTGTGTLYGDPPTEQVFERTVTIYGILGTSAPTLIGAYTINNAAKTATGSVSTATYDTIRFVITGFIDYWATYDLSYDISATPINYYSEICELPGENVDYLLSTVHDEVNNTVAAYINGVFQNKVTLGTETSRAFAKNAFIFTGGDDFILSKSRLRGPIAACDSLFPVMFSAKHIMLHGFTNDTDAFMSEEDIETALQYYTRQLYGCERIFSSSIDLQLDNYIKNPVLSLDNYDTGISKVRNIVSLPIEYPQGEATVIFPNIYRTTYQDSNEGIFGYPASVVFIVGDELYAFSEVPDSASFQAINSENIVTVITKHAELSKYFETSREFNTALNKWYTKITTKGVDPAKCHLLILSEVYHIEDNTDATSEEEIWDAVLNTTGGGSDDLKTVEDYTANIYGYLTPTSTSITGQMITGSTSIFSGKHLQPYRNEVMYDRTSGGAYTPGFNSVAYFMDPLTVSQTVIKNYSDPKYRAQIRLYWTVSFRINSQEASVISEDALSVLKYRTQVLQLEDNDKLYRNDKQRKIATLQNLSQRKDARARVDVTVVFDYSNTLKELDRVQVKVFPQDTKRLQVFEEGGHFMMWTLNSGGYRHKDFYVFGIEHTQNATRLHLVEALPGDTL